MIIHYAPQFAIYFGDAKDALEPETYRTLGSIHSLGHQSVKPIAKQLCFGQLVFLKQIHSVEGIAVSGNSVPVSIKEGDFLVTNDNSLGLGVFTADCLPIIMYDKYAHAIGIAHAGWRGATAGIIEAMLECMSNTYQTDIHNVVSYFGPSARRCCYQVDGNFKSNLEDCTFIELVLRKSGDKTYFDLPGYCEQKLLKMGISPESVKREYNACTICDERFYSSRRKNFERQMTIVSLK